MAEKIKVIRLDRSVVEVDLDKFYRDYRKEIAPLTSCGTVILPSEYFKKWVEKNKE
jgi:hypothetical protein